MREYESLRKEIEQDIQELRAVERYAVLGTAAIWTWLASTTNLPVIFRLAWWIPLFLVILAGIRAFAIWQMMKLAALYIKQLEERLGVEGWETYSGRVKGIVVRYSSLLFWLILVFVTITWPMMVVFRKK